MAFCGHCGHPLDALDHADCVRRLELEPPRYCAHCRRRLQVQVIPGEWTSRCVEHGQTSASTWSSGSAQGV